MGNSCSHICYYDDELKIELKFINKMRAIQEKYICTLILPKKPINNKNISYVYLEKNYKNISVYFFKYIFENIFENIGEKITFNFNSNIISTNLNNYMKVFEKMKNIYKYQNDDKYYYFDIFSKYNKNIIIYENKKIIMKKDLVDRFYFIIY
jgi:hypothetical protein